MATQRGQIREGRFERQRTRLLQQSEPRQAGPQGSTARGRQQARLFLRPHEGDEIEADKREDGQRPGFADQQEPAGMELLTWK